MINDWGLNDSENSLRTYAMLNDWGLNEQEYKSVSWRQRADSSLRYYFWPLAANCIFLKDAHFILRWQFMGTREKRTAVLKTAACSCIVFCSLPRISAADWVPEELRNWSSLCKVSWPASAGSSGWLLPGLCRSPAAFIKLHIEASIYTVSHECGTKLPALSQRVKQDVCYLCAERSPWHCLLPLSVSAAWKTWARPCLTNLNQRWASVSFNVGW